MQHIYLVPYWFLGIDVAIEVILAIAASIVSYYAFKVYKLSGQDQPRFFGAAFMFIAVSYLFQAVLNSFVIHKLGDPATQTFGVSITLLSSLGMYLHMLLYVIGLVALVYTTLGIRSMRTYSIILTITLLSLVFSANKLYMFYILSTVILAFILFHYLLNFITHRQLRTFLVFLAFGFLLFGSLHFALSVNHAIYYVIGHVLELIAYILILSNLLIIIKHGHKTR